ncbi:ammonium transporter [Rhodospirillaceae bacterium LM-1]|nr:ammonium transporter [Rhodospirillaceae bacterium LM-1]
MSFKMPRTLTSAAVAVPALLASALAWAEEAAPAAAPAAEAAVEAVAEAAAAAAPVLNSGDTAWMLVSSILVLMMLIPGLALFYGGMVRKKNVLAMLMQNFMAASLLSVVWFVIGYSLAFTEGNAFIGGFGRLMLGGVDPSTLSGTIPETVFAMFQGTFAIITPALIIGGFADRMKFGPMLAFLVLWMLGVYIPVAHMVWGPGGLMLGMGTMDFAGGTVVHINAGVAGLVAAIVIGKRKGYGTEHLAPHNLVLSMIGASLLWVGWFGFNAGSALSAGGLAGYVMANTHLATAAAAVSWTFAEWMLKGKPSLLGAVSGAVAGLVAITPACGFVDLKGALIIGLLAGAICLWGVTGLKHMFGYDDALDCFGVHGVGGILGAILTGVFAVATIGGEGKSGLIDGNAGQVLTQVISVGITIAWTAIGSFVILKVLDLTVGLRVSEEAEREGLDLACHGETIHS